MKFRTEVRFDSYPDRIETGKPLVLMGSCFSDNVGEKLKYYLFDAEVNPFGVTYNPVSLASSLGKLLDKESYTEQDLDFQNELWFSFDHYTKFSDTSKEKALEKINNSFLAAKKKLKNASHLLLTFGTAFTYSLQEGSRVVNNCHKLPAATFNRRMLGIVEIVETYRSLISRLIHFNPGLKIIFTVSPIRHAKDGFVENQRSKSTLHLAVSEILKIYPEVCWYFPAYEIMMDELRDYRFYDSDMLHPSQQAVDYIWEKFMDHMISNEAKECIRELNPLLTGMHHRPLHAETSAFRKFEAGLKKKEEVLKAKYPELQWGKIL